jgi:hypothetical protein
MKKNNALGPLCHALALTAIGLDPAAVRAWGGGKPFGFPEELGLRRGRFDRLRSPECALTGRDCYTQAPPQMATITLDDILQTMNEPSRICHSRRSLMRISMGESICTTSVAT